MPRNEIEKRVCGATPSYPAMLRRGLNTCAVVGIVAVLATSMSSCKNPNRPGRYRPPTSTSTVTPQPASTPVQATSADESRRAATAPSRSSIKGSGTTDRVQLIDDESARELGLQSAWQQRIPYKGSGGLKQVFVAGGDLVVVDGRNVMTVYDARSGKEAWHEAPVPPREIIFGIDRFDLDQEDLLLVTTDTDLYVIGADTGLTITRQDLAQIPSTPVLKAGDELIYGTARGRIVWHNVPVGYELKANGLESKIAGAPVRRGNRAAAVSARGRVGLFDAGNARRLWTRQVNAGFEFGPAMSDRALYASDTGQRVNCFEIESGETLWTYFTADPPSAPPQIFDDRIIQSVGTGGTICLEAVPSAGSRNGKVLWKNSNLQGEVVTALGDDLVVWMPGRGVLNLVDSNDGSIKFAVDMPAVDAIQVGFDERTGRQMLLAFNRDGRIQRLDPRK
ncbi:MAG: PQQ-binding-like beta-propeller repeat protein [Planctomycetota bacterium]|nr:PQQ-binding-like beta-propeller repeat protein [Planctomycetota bacterium]